MNLDKFVYNRSGLSAFLSLLVLILVVGTGSFRSGSLSNAVRILHIVDPYPGSVHTNMNDPRPLVTNYDVSAATTAHSEYLVSATSAQVEQWYVNQFTHLGCAEASHASSNNGGYSVAANYEVDFTSAHLPLVTYQVGLKSLSERKTLIYVLVTDPFTLRPASSYLSSNFDRAEVSTYSVTSAMVSERVSPYPFLLKKTEKHILRSYTVRDRAVVRNWIKVLNELPVEPRIGVVDCPSIGPVTQLTLVTFMSSNSSLKRTATLATDCRGLPGIGGVTLWDPTGRFRRAINSYLKSRGESPIAATAS